MNQWLDQQIVWYYGKEKNGEKNDVSSTTMVPLYFASKFA